MLIGAGTVAGVGEAAAGAKPRAVPCELISPSSRNQTITDCPKYDTPMKFVQWTKSAHPSAHANRFWHVEQCESRRAVACG